MIKTFAPCSTYLCLSSCLSFHLIPPRLSRLILHDPRDSVIEDEEDEEKGENVDEDGDDDDVWEEMEDAESDTEARGKGGKKWKSG